MRIAYVGPFSFPVSSANSLRVQGVAFALSLSGADVLVGSADHVMPPEALTYSVERVSIHPLEEFPQVSWPRWRRVVQGIDAGERTARWIETLSPRPDVIMVYGTSFGYLRRLLPLARKMGIPLILDVVEWYEPSHLPGGQYGPVAAAFEYSMRCLAPKADGVIAISRYLEDYFKDKGVPTLRVPPLSFPSPRPRQYRESDGSLHLCYAGNPGKKDNIKTVLQAVISITENNKGVVLHFVGVETEELITLMRTYDLNDPPNGSRIKIIAHGRVNNATARSIVGSCDFSVLLRDQARFSQAGFPSKVAESLILGTPVMANLTSNLDEILIDGRNSILFLKTDEKYLKKSIKNIINNKYLDIEKMKFYSRIDGIRLFDRRNYVKQLIDFINNLF